MGSSSGNTYSSFEYDPAASAEAARKAAELADTVLLSAQADLASTAALSSHYHACLNLLELNRVRRRIFAQSPLGQPPLDSLLPETTIFVTPDMLDAARRGRPPGALFGFAASGTQPEGLRAAPTWLTQSSILNSWGLSPQSSRATPPDETPVHPRASDPALPAPDALPEAPALDAGSGSTEDMAALQHVDWTQLLELFNQIL